MSKLKCMNCRRIIFISGTIDKDDVYKLYCPYCEHKAMILK